MLDHFQKKFLEEATDLINNLEQALLKIEQNPHDKPLIEEIFRVMHSLKGGGAMFGFDKISNFTHNLETVYDFVRTGKLEISKDLLDITLQSVDLLRNLLNKDDENNPNVIAQTEKLTNQILSIQNQIENIDKKEDFQITEIIQPKQKIYLPVSTYFIRFVPDEHLFYNGTNPLFLLDELLSLGHGKTFNYHQRVPNLDKYNSQNCYLQWSIVLATYSIPEAIKDIFIFVEDDCDLEVRLLSTNDLFADTKFETFLEQLSHTSLDIKFSDIERFLKPGIYKIDKTENQEKRNTTITKENFIASIRVASDKIDQLMNLVSELVTTQARLGLFAEKNHDGELKSIAENVENITRQLRDIAFNISLIPIETLMTRFQRLVRDLSVDLNKDIAFTAEGTDTELDKTLIQSLTDPLMHILRNSVDHGIEKPAVRIAKGKDPQGKITLKAFYSGANVHIKIQDDGKGIDTEQIKHKAVSKGFLLPEAQPTRKELFDILFQPGFSTTESVTDVSGRGVGMDVVRRKIAEVRGEVEVDSIIDQGTTITIKIPLTLSIIDGLLVKVNQTHMIIPLSVVDKIFAAEHQFIEKSYNNIIALDGVQYPFLYLRREFDILENGPDMEQIVVVKFEDKKMGLVVDYVVGEYQAVLKPLGQHYKKQDIISGATILGDGTIALVIDTNKIISIFTN